MSDPSSRSLGGVEEVWAACREISETDPQDFAVVKKEGVSHDLADAVPVVERIVSFYQNIGQADLQMVPADRLSVFSQEIRNVLHAFEHVRGMRYRKPADAANTLMAAYYSTRTELAALVGGDTAQEPIRKMVAAASRAVIEVKEIREQARQALRDVQKIAGEVGVASYANTFGKAAKAYGRQKWVWLGALGLLSAVAIWVAWWVATDLQPVDAQNVGLTIQMATVKLFAFGILSYLILLTGRGYRAAAHNQIVNQHRSLALETFRGFVEAASDDATEDAVLMQATHAIFSHRPSGFGHQENDTAPPSHMVELTRGVMGDRGSAE
ncbi:MAG: hypothetical protein OXU64_08510 [Gemmatimonadota bacterium]|nr:hypothetical protein [Gemmatimonadota bacterium]